MLVLIFLEAAGTKNNLSSTVELLAELTIQFQCLIARGDTEVSSKIDRSRNPLG